MNAVDNQGTLICIPESKRGRGERGRAAGGGRDGGGL